MWSFAKVPRMGMFDLREPYVMWGSKLWKNIKSSETFNVTTVPLLGGLQALQKYKGEPEEGGLDGGGDPV